METKLQKISGQCDALPGALRKEKERQGKTNQQIADDTGLSVYTINKLLAGSMSNPGIFTVAPVCLCLGLSMDRLMGAEVPEGDTEALEMELAHAREMIGEKDKEIALLKERSEIMQDGLRDRTRTIDETRQMWKPILYGLCGLCILLTVLMISYIALDYNDPEHGFIRSGKPTPGIIIALGAVIICAIMLLHVTVSRWYKRKK